MTGRVQGRMDGRVMRVLQVLPALNGGGVEKGTLEIAQALVQAGHESWVMSAGGRLVAELEQNGSRHIEWHLEKKSPFTFLQVRAVRRWLRENPVDIIHVRSRMPAWILYLAWKKLPPQQRPHLVSTVHGLHSVSRYSAIMNCGERVIVVSETLRDYVLQHYPAVDAAKLRLIYRGVDPADYPWHYQPTEQWRANWQQQFPQLAGKFVVTLPGRITRLKGHHAFLRLIQTLRQSQPDVVGLIVGGDDPKRMAYRRELDSAVQQAGLQDAIIFTGHRSDMRDIYAASSVVLSLSSKPESFGRTVLEALSMGVPVVGYAHGGVGEILRTLYPAGAAPLNDEAGVARAIVALRADAPRIAPNTQFLLANMQQQTLAVYQELLSS